VSEGQDPLYDREAAAFLQRREAGRAAGDDEKFALLLGELADCRRLVDIGCGWGQFLGKVAAARPDVTELWGVDESPDRAADVAAACPAARTVICRADRLDLPDAHFDVAVTSQMLHEVKLFGRPGQMAETLAEIRRVLAPGGRWLLLDHQDAGDGEAVVSMPAALTARLAEFESRFRFYDASHEQLPDGSIRISRRCLQDFLTKAWSLGSPMERMEMNETHNVFRRAETVGLLASAGFTVTRWLDFADIREDLARAGAELLSGTRWPRKFLVTATKEHR